MKFTSKKNIYRVDYDYLDLHLRLINITKAKNKTLVVKFKSETDKLKLFKCHLRILPDGQKTPITVNNIHFFALVKFVIYCRMVDFSTTDSCGMRLTLLADTLSL